MRDDPRARDFGRADRALVVLSDVELGAGGPTDDFPDAPWFADLLESYCEGPWAELPLDLVFNGDTFDLLKTPAGADGSFTHLVDAEVGCDKLGRVLDAHPRFVAAVRALLAHDRAPRRVVFLVGNHDFELLFPEVQESLRARLGARADEVAFPGFGYDVGDVHVEHGSQSDPLFRMDPEAPFLAWEGRRILDLPWGSVALTDVAMPIHHLLYPCDRARPSSAVLAQVPDLRAVLLDRYWKYWTRDWLGAWWSASDPMKRVSWTMFRQVAWRLQSGDPSIVLDRAQEAELARPERRLVLLGHLHDPTLHTVHGTRILRTGCLRDEFDLLPDGTVGEVRAKVYAEVLLRHGRVFRSRHVELSGAPGVAAAMPPTIRDVQPALDALRGEAPESSRAQSAQLAHERDRS